MAGPLEFDGGYKQGMAPYAGVTFSGNDIDVTRYAAISPTVDVVIKYNGAGQDVPLTAGSGRIINEQVTTIDLVSPASAVFEVM